MLESENGLSLWWDVDMPDAAISYSYSATWITFGADVAVSGYVFFGWETALC